MKFRHLVLPIAIFVSAPALAENQLYIAQTGEPDQNYAEGVQDCVGADCNNIGGIVQVYTDYEDDSGALNPGALNNAFLKQVGQNNQGYITQEGNNNSAEMLQHLGGYADIKQVEAFDSYVSVNQYKDKEDGTLSDGNNVAGVTQSGIAQWALVKQFGGEGTAFLTQEGDSNAMTIIQNKGAVGEYVDAKQNGWGNFGHVVMNGQNDVVTLVQLGMKNNVDVDVAATSVGSQIDAYQQGQFNNAKLYTQGEGNYIWGAQNDSENYVEVAQLGDAQTVKYNQDGLQNIAFVGQYEDATGAMAMTNQFGSNNYLGVYQFAPNSLVNVTQSGNGNVAVISQQ